MIESGSQIHLLLSFDETGWCHDWASDLWSDWVRGRTPNFFDILVAIVFGHEIHMFIPYFGLDGHYANILGELHNHPFLFWSFETSKSEDILHRIMLSTDV